MEKMISIYWFAILILVAVGIASMVFMFYSHPYDVREAEAIALTERVADCMIEGGKLKQEFLNFNGDLLKKCHITFDVEKELEKGQYFLGVDILDLGSRNSINKINEGNPTIKTHCSPQAEEEIQQLSTCIETEIYSIDNSNKQYLIKILSIVRKTQKNVK